MKIIFSMVVLIIIVNVLDCGDIPNYPDYVDLEISGRLPQDSAFAGYEINFSGTKYLIFSFDDAMYPDYDKDVLHKEITIEPQATEYTLLLEHLRNQDYHINISMLNSDRDTLFTLLEGYNVEVYYKMHIDLDKPYAILTPWFKETTIQLSDRIDTTYPLQFRYSNSGILEFSNVEIESSGEWITNLILEQSKYYPSKFTIYASIKAPELPIGLSSGAINIYLNRPFRDTIAIPINVKKSAEWGIIHTFGQDTSKATSPQFSPKGTYLLINSKGDRLFHVNQWRPATEFQNLMCNYNAIISNDEQWILFTDSPQWDVKEHCLCYSNLASRTSYNDQLCSKSYLSNAIISPDNRFIATLVGYDSFAIFDRETGDRGLSFDLNDFLENTAWSPDMSFMFVASSNYLYVYDTKKYNLIEKIRIGQGGKIFANPDKNIILSGTARVSYDTFLYQGHLPEYFLSVSPLWDYILTYNDDSNKIQIKSLDDSKLINEFEGTCSFTFSASWLPNSNIIATTDNFYVYIWDIGALIE